MDNERALKVELRRALDLQFHLPHGRQVFIELALIRSAKIFLQPGGVFTDKIQYAFSIAQAGRAIFLNLARDVIRKQPLEHQARVHFRRHGG